MDQVSLTLVLAKLTEVKKRERKKNKKHTISLTRYIFPSELAAGVVDIETRKRFALGLQATSN